MLAQAQPEQSLFDLAINTYVPALAEGLVVTVGLTVLGIICTAVVAFTLGLMRTARNLLVRGVARTIVDFFRSTSLVIQLFWLYFALPIITGYELDKFVAGLLAIALNYGSYASEIVRGSIQAVPKGQWEAGVAVNMTNFQRMRRIIIPQAIPLMLPSFGNTVVELLKGTSLVYLIRVTDMTWKADQLRGLHGADTWLILGLLLIMYFAIAWILTRGIRFLERRANTSVGRPPPPPSPLWRALTRSRPKVPAGGSTGPEV